MPIYSSKLVYVLQRCAAFLVLLAGLSGLASAQISPGPLSRAHQQWEGVTKCSSCHDFGGGDRRLKCLECHTEIQRRVTARTGFHAKNYNASPSEMDCTRCHMEHNGHDFPLTRLERKAFDHRALTGFALEGKHKEQKCEACHTANHITATAKAEIKIKDLNHSFLGLGRDCGSCHEDKHAGQLGGDCTRCHSQDAWKPTPGFNHAKTSFPLTGQHQAVACQKCHDPKPGDKTARYKGLPFASCQNCHADPHKGAFQDAKVQGSCEKCHNTSGWMKNQPSTNFSHSNTKFPLLGKHAEAACAQCHKDSDFHRPVAHEHCENCHEDIHKGQFAKRAAGSECSTCHNQTSFKPTLFTRETHQNSGFKLEGKHAALECAKCHQPEGKGALYVTKKLLCNDCHADPHAGEFAKSPYFNECDRCHTQNSFQPSTFTSERHAQTKFMLAGAHAAVECSKCHTPLSATQVAAAPVDKAAAPALARVANTASAARLYHFERQNCVACHSDPHRTNLACETCHDVQQWKQTKLFDHRSTNFALEGAHQAVMCASCHKPAAANAKSTLGFFQTPQQCSECHQDVHGGQFMTATRKEDCKSCHTMSKWNSDAFDHNATAYPLDGFHVRVSCAQCHKQQKEVAGKMIRIYRGTPTECTKCH